MTPDAAWGGWGSEGNSGHALIIVRYPVSRGYADTEAGRSVILPYVGDSGSCKSVVCPLL